ncbi:hypothetical protein [Membranihabitans marinus]|uniref:hypothetical protein n=1 Tax=Membranihabitans marinus TaxID=1227546 RepID=UPI001F421BB9|nr:hypothetical protein [Membranihabitans marinus]
MKLSGGQPNPVNTTEISRPIGLPDGLNVHLMKEPKPPRFGRAGDEEAEGPIPRVGGQKHPNP